MPRENQGLDVNWTDLYRTRLTTAEDAVKHVRSGMRVSDRQLLSTSNCAEFLVVEGPEHLEIFNGTPMPGSGH